MPSDRHPRFREAQPADRTIAEFSRRLARQRSMLRVVLLIEFALGVLWMMTSRKGPWAVGCVVVMVIFAIAATALYLIRWRCPSCGKLPGPVASLNYCRSCGSPLAEGASNRVEQTPERAEWVVSTLRRRSWWVRGAFALVLGVSGLLAWRLGPADLRPWASGIFVLGLLGWIALVARVWRCPECETPLKSYDVERFCNRCGVPHDRKGLERARAQS